MGVAINDLQTRIDNTPLEDRQRRWMSDSQNSLREFYKTDVILMSNSLSKNLKELKDELIEEKNDLLIAGLEKISNDSKDIQANLLKRIKILENDFKRSQAQSIDFELKLQNQKEKMACDVSWKSKLSTINDENVLLKTQVDFVVKERENIKLKYQKLFNSIKATRTQHQKELDELIEHVNQKTYAYADVRAQNQDLLITISELKNKLKTVDKGKNVNSKFDKSETSGTLLCVTRLPKNIAVKAKKVSNSKVNTDRLKPVTSHLTPKNEQSQTQNENVIARGMYRITKTETQTPDSKTNINVSRSTGVESSNSVRRPKSKDTKSKNRVLKNTNAKSSTAHVWKMLRSASIDFNKRETMHSNNKTAQSLPSETKSRIRVRSTSNTPVTTHKWVARLGCSKHMTGNLQLLRNFIMKFMGTVRFGNDHFAAITRYGDYVQGNLTICYVYYVEGLGHNLFSVGQFYDGDLEVAFHSNTCYVQNLEGDDLLTGSA
ncbi:hypothetical protein Tco_0448989 [Tanacetum coccineum]